MKRIGIIIGIVVVVLVAALLVIPNLIPSDVYRSTIEAQGTKALGRDVKVGGKIGVSIFPRIEARAEGGTIANPAEFGAAPFASMKELRAAVKLIPLLFGKVEIDEFVLVDPKIDLIQLENGRNNWTFDLPKPEEEKPSKPGEAISASLGDVRIINGQVSYDDQLGKQKHALTKFDLKAKMDAIDKPFSIESSGVADTLPFKLKSNIENPKALMEGAISKVLVDLDTDLLKTKLDGQLGLGDKPTFDFKFDGEVPSAVKLADAFQVKDLPARAVLGKLTASGQAFGSPDDITLKLASARHESPLLNADLKGETRVAKAITLALQANAEVPKLADLAKAMAIDAPAGEALGKATVTTKINGELGDLTFSDVNFRHDSGLLKIAFDGNARLNTALTYAGRVSINAPDLRGLAAAANAKLPEGDVYKTFSLTGDTSGGTSDVLLKNAVVQFDSIQGKGEAALALGGARPKLTGSLTTGDIDVTPYAKSSGAPTDKQPQKAGDWGATPVDLTPLKLADANLSLKTGGIKYDKFDFGPSNIAVNLANGRLVTDLKQSTLFGGAGTASFVADGSSAVPAVAIKAKFSSLSLKPFMQAAAGFDMVEGKGDVNLDLTGSGGTVQALMASLGGAGKFGFGDGAISGVNLTELGNAAKTALSSKTISLAAFGKDQKTTFSNLGASFAMKDGVAAMADLKMDAGSFLVSGGGSLDVGKQKLSLSLFPEFKDKKQGLNGYGLPIKLAGGWNGVGLNLDWDWLAKKAVGDVKTKVTNEIQDELQKNLGSKLGDLLNKNGKPTVTPAPPPAQTEPPAQATAQETPKPAEPAPAPAEPAKKLEDKAKDEAKKALGKLFGN